jgi:hypothetical protein
MHEVATVNHIGVLEWFEVVIDSTHLRALIVNVFRDETFMLVFEELDDEWIHSYVSMDLGELAVECSFELFDTIKIDVEPISH